MLRKLVAIEISSTELREITDALVILSIAVIAYLATSLIVIDNVFEMPQARPSIFVGIALATLAIRRTLDQRRERKQRLAAEDRAHMLSVCDPLTQLPNRRQFETQLSNALRIGTRPIIILVGLEKFGNFDDLYGRSGSDAALCQVAARVGQARTLSNFIARIADYEFALCFEHKDLEKVRSTAVGLVRSIKEPLQLGMEYSSIGANVGIARADRNLMTVEELLRCAHIALSRARNTKAECCVFDREMDALIQEQSILERNFRTALSRNEIRSYFQPIVDIQSKRIVAFESLARWNHSVKGYISPESFIPLAEELGLSDDLSGRLFADACRSAARWPEDISLSFNFSPSQLANRHLPGAIKRVLDSTGLPAHRLEIEVTERALVADLGGVRETLQMLRNFGVRIVIDDFGTGYSSLYHLYELRFDKLKIDKHFIQELGTSEESDIFLRAIIGLSRGLELCVAAEGVETGAQVEALSRLGAHQAQGFLFGKAIPPWEVAQLLSVESIEREAA
jgi:diguanylate cyclase (GGDEF)-like protein